MFKILRATKDAYLTDRVIKGQRRTKANTGDASSLDAFKLYGITSSGSSPNVELSRLLVKFDLEPLRQLVQQNKVDPSHSSFNCTLKLFDVYGGQPTPRNFKLVVHPLSRSFDEGLGRDVVLYSDEDACNFLTSSWTDGAWHLSGANLGGSGSCDYFVSFVDNVATRSVEASQTFTTGEEDLSVDVTRAVSGVLAGFLPDEGFRIAFTASIENDTRTYFVKRFAARHAFDSSYHPQLFVKFDDSIQEDSTYLKLDTSSSLVFYNYGHTGLTNVVSGSSTLTGSNCMLLKMILPISGGNYTQTVSASQVKIGNLNRTGIYSASVYVSSLNSNVITHLQRSGSVPFTPVWSSVDGTVGFFTGSKVTFYPSLRGSTDPSSLRHSVSILGLPADVSSTDELTLRVFIFDQNSPTIRASRLPSELPGLGLRDVHYQVRDSLTNKVIVPFDTGSNSTRCSSDEKGSFFKVNFEGLAIGRSYVIDIMTNFAGEKRTYPNSSAPFRLN